MELLFPISFLAFALLLTSCETNRTSSEPVVRLPDPTPREAFQMGIGYGRSDRQSGYGPLPARHDARIPLRSRAEFARGYDRGYRSAGRVRLREIGPPAPQVRW